MGSTKRARVLSVATAVTFVIASMIAGYVNIGLPPVVIVGGSGVVALVMWIRTYLRCPLDPRFILPAFLLTVAALEVHMAEEYVAGFGPAMSRLFDISWTERSFLMIFAFVEPALYALTALGLYFRVPLAGFLAWFIFIGPAWPSSRTSSSRSSGRRSPRTFRARSPKRCRTAGSWPTCATTT